MSQIAKQAAGAAAAAVIEPGMVLGYGTGTTVECFLRSLASRGLDVAGVPSSLATAHTCRALGLPLLELADVGRLDLVVDGADELTPDLVLTKGGGAALLREKVVAQMADRMLVIATPDKVVDRLADTFALPIEVIPFATPSVLRQLQARDWTATVRLGVRSDNGNDIVDARLAGGIEDPRAVAEWLQAMAGVAEHGLFIGLATAAVLGDQEGSTRWVGKL